MSTKPQTPRSVDEYVAGFPHEVQDLLQQIRAAIREAAPEAGETISYGIPTFTLNGRYLIYFAAYKKHLSLYPAPVGVPEFAADLAAYQAGKGSLQFPYGQPVPFDLIRRIVQFRASENLDKGK